MRLYERNPPVQSSFLYGGEKRTNGFVDSFHVQRSGPGRCENLTEERTDQFEIVFDEQIRRGFSRSDQTEQACNDCSRLNGKSREAGHNAEVSRFPQHGIRSGPCEVNQRYTTVAAPRGQPAKATDRIRTLQGEICDDTDDGLKVQPLLIDTGDATAGHHSDSVTQCVTSIKPISKYNDSRA
ncbi:hypothetical protein GCM10007887_29220 [Methylobacterium haplocladii]|uniref:Uncharacterized protein n=1 Tax=Methylobacterium haplocladii TaxID=1176176 RepID=A0A512IMB1_9HYPH|nr:hypothetical protein MHA02_11760 [Methylobacterium haplocladii]GLS60244.1 hypothetical protein GCM10007887_29220 [Methylobacterium haplocladii]